MKFFGLVGAWTGLRAMKGSAEERSGLMGLAGVFVLAGVLMAVQGFRNSPLVDPVMKSLSQPVNVKLAMGFAFTVAGGLCVVAALTRARVMMFGGFWALAAGFALWFNWGHWVDLSHHWTQRDLFWSYYRQSKPDEPITAFLMNWRGETFYSRNRVKQIREVPKLKPFVDQPGREWALVEHPRLKLLRDAVGPDKTVTVIERDINNKFLLVTIE